MAAATSVAGIWLPSGARSGRSRRVSPRDASMGELASRRPRVDWLPSVVPQSESATSRRQRDEPWPGNLRRGGCRSPPGLVRPPPPPSVRDQGGLNLRDDGGTTLNSKPQHPPWKASAPPADLLPRRGERTARSRVSLRTRRGRRAETPTTAPRAARAAVRPAGEPARLPCARAPLGAVARPPG